MGVTLQKKFLYHLISDHENFYGGRVFGEINSDANFHIDEDGLITGAIHLPDETYHIEVGFYT